MFEKYFKVFLYNAAKKLVMWSVGFASGTFVNMMKEVMYCFSAGTGLVIIALYYHDWIDIKWGNITKSIIEILNPNLHGGFIKWL